MKQIILQDAFEAFLHSSIFISAVYWLGDKQGVLVNNECSFCCKRVDTSLLPVLDRREEIFMMMDQHADQPHSQMRGQWDSVLLPLSVSDYHYY